MKRINDFFKCYKSMIDKIPHVGPLTISSEEQIVTNVKT